MKKEVIVSGESRFITCLEKEITDPEYRLLVCRWGNPTKRQVPVVIVGLNGAGVLPKKSIQLLEGLDWIPANQPEMGNYGVIQYDPTKYKI